MAGKARLCAAGVRGCGGARLRHGLYMRLGHIMVTWFARAPVRAVVAWYALHTPQRARTTTERISMADIYIRIRARFLRLQHAGSSARMSLAALPCGGGCTGAHWAEGVAPRSRMSAPAPSEPARGRPQLTACWLLCGRSSPPPLCSPSRRRPWRRARGAGWGCGSRARANTCADGYRWGALKNCN